MAGTADGRVLAYKEAETSTELVSGGHSGLVSGLASSSEQTLSVGYDDTIREVSSDEKSMT